MPRKEVYRAPKKKEVVLATKVRNPDDYITIRIDSKNQLQIHKDRDPEKAIKEYKERMANKTTWLPGMKSKTYK